MPFFAKFHTVVQYKTEIQYNCLLRYGAKYPSLKKAQGGNFQLGSISYLFQCIKLSYFVKFSAVVLKYD